MAYGCDLGAGQQLLIENQGTQTLITLSRRESGQQQSQRTGIETGEWAAPPAVFRTASGLIVRLESVRRQTFLQLQAGQMQVLANTPLLLGAEALPLHTIANSSPAPSMSSMPTMAPMTPMNPMKPMQMGDMHMQMEPMEMRMGDMHLRMEKPKDQPTSQTTTRFCPQCGNAVKAVDRFCSQCGNQLNLAG